MTVLCVAALLAAAACSTEKSPEVAKKAATPQSGDATVADESTHEAPVAPAPGGKTAKTGDGGSLAFEAEQQTKTAAAAAATKATPDTAQANMATDEPDAAPPDAPVVTPKAATLPAATGACTVALNLLFAATPAVQNGDFAASAATGKMLYEIFADPPAGATVTFSQYDWRPGDAAASLVRLEHFPAKGPGSYYLTPLPVGPAITVGAVSQVFCDVTDANGTSVGKNSARILWQ